MSNRNGNETSRILINATQAEEVRVAITCGRFLDNLFIEEIGSHRTGNIYKARVTRVVPSLQAAFVDFGSERHGFLPLKEIAPEYFRNPVTSDHYNILEVLSEGQELIVQVEKEERGTKGAALTTFITLAGCYLVLMPNNPSAGGISRRIEGEERDQLREYINALNMPESMGLIIRTAGVGRMQEEIEWDLDLLLRLWQAIQDAANSRTAPFLIHQESDIVIRALRDYLRRDISEIIIDSPALYEKAKQHVSTIRPEFASHIKLYQDKAIPLFTRYHIEDQIESAFLREVELPSGGYIVIQETEAMVTIDVNSARDTKAGNIEQTAFNTNREAAIEVARQMRLRDLGGLIAIDFIDMLSTENQQKVVDVFKDETRSDKARVQFNRISRFGILEVSRQRLRPSLTESSQIVCPRCAGRGSIRSVESLGLLLLRLIRQEALLDNVVAVNVQVPIEVAAFLVNEKRLALTEIETYHHTVVRILPNAHIQTPQYKIERTYDQSTQQETLPLPSYKMVEKIDQLEANTPVVRVTSASSRYSEPAVKGLEAPSKPSARKQSLGIFTRLKQLFANNEKPEEPTTPASTQPESRQQNQRQQNGRQQQRPRNNHGQSRNPNQNRHQSRDRDGQQPRSQHQSRQRYDRDDAPQQPRHHHDQATTRHEPQQRYNHEHSSRDNESIRHEPLQRTEPRHQHQQRPRHDVERATAPVNKEEKLPAVTLTAVTETIVDRERAPVLKQDIINQLERDVSAKEIFEADAAPIAKAEPNEPTSNVPTETREPRQHAPQRSGAREPHHHAPAARETTSANSSLSVQTLDSPLHIEHHVTPAPAPLMENDHPADNLAHAENADGGEAKEKRRYRNHRNRYRQRSGQRRRSQNNNENSEATDAPQQSDSD